MDISKLLQRADRLIAKGEEVITSTYQMQHDTMRAVDSAKMAGVRSSGLSFIEKVFGKEQTYYLEFDNSSSDEYDYNAERSLAILREVREEIADGWVVSLESLISATIFTDFIEMADHLLAQGYRIPAAVTAGSALEAHLKILAQNNNISVSVAKGGKSTPKKADLINAELVKASVYSKLEQKLVTSWLGIRNEAAHGNYNGFSDDQTKDMISGVTSFISQFKS